jgi:hypothetical protein
VRDADGSVKDRFSVKRDAQEAARGVSQR